MNASGERVIGDRETAREIRRLALVWLTLLLMAALEFGASFMPISRTLRPLIIIPSGLMIVTLAIGFLEIKQGPAIVRAFAVAALFWLLVLLGLGSIDTLTRVDYHIDGPRVE